VDVNLEEVAMKTLQILGMGCARCHTLAQRTEEAAQALGLEYTIEKVTDFDAIVAAGTMVTPALVVDGEIKVAGRVPTVDAIRAMLG
jgi:small redox-active disulfide protein 2